jgi:hypothetical protein
MQGVVAVAARSAERRLRTIPMNPLMLPATRKAPRRLVLLAMFGMLCGCANSDFGEVNQTLVTNGIHDSPPPKAEPSKFEYTDDERALRDNAYP